MVLWWLVHVSPSFLDGLLHVWRSSAAEGPAGVSGEQGVRLAGVWRWWEGPTRRWINEEH